jgi:hypothetical protein
MAIPTYCQDDPALARVVDEAAADVFLRGFGDQTVPSCCRGNVGNCRWSSRMPRC